MRTRSTIKTIIFSLIPALIIFAIIEGGARIYWNHLKDRAFNEVNAAGERMLANDAINFMKVADPLLGYRIRPNLDTNGLKTNAQGFYQSEPVALEREPRSFRLFALGGSLTAGNGDGPRNYPYFLGELLAAGDENYPGGVESINAGVPGWVSDQVAIWAETELAAYKPDVVLINSGWNDFQSYDPQNYPPEESYFTTAYGSSYRFTDVSFLKSVVLARNLLHAATSRPAAQPKPAIWSEEGVIPLTNVIGWKRQGPDVSISDGPPDSGVNWARSLELSGDSYVYTILPEAAINALEDGEPLSLSATVQGSGEVELRLNGAVSPWPIYRQCRVRLTAEPQRVRCEIENPPHGDMDLQISLINAGGQPTSIVFADAQLDRGPEPREIFRSADQGSDFPLQETYRFYLQNLDRIVAAYRRENPAARFAITTLVAQWPVMTDEAFHASTGAPWWVKNRDMSQSAARYYVERLNDLIRDYAKSNGLLLIDLSPQIPDSERRAIMRDFVHMTNPGYKLYAELVYSSLVEAGYFDGPPLSAIEGK